MTLRMLDGAVRFRLKNAVSDKIVEATVADCSTPLVQRMVTTTTNSNCVDEINDSRVETV